jgi:cation transport regulator ChaC
MSAKVALGPKLHHRVDLLLFGDQAVEETATQARPLNEEILPYIFGYGSLIEQASRLRAMSSALYVLPARARGFARGWWHRTGAIGFTTTFLGAIPEKSSSVNGVIYAVNKQELDDTDTREIGYTREDIASHLEILSGGSVPQGEIYIYLDRLEENNVPARDFPIVQSYVDICLTGCLQIEKGFPNVVDFAREFIKSTKEWSKFWENDRAHPRRAPFTVPNASKIDKLLQEHLPDKLFDKIQPAPGRW